MRSSWGNVKVINDRGGRYIRGWERKKYVRQHPYPTHTMRIAPLKREKATIIAQRKAGLPINMIAKFLGRSTSFIHRTLHSESARVFSRPIDMRKLPGKARILYGGYRWRKLVSLWSAWEAFLLGETDRPP